MLNEIHEPIELARSIITWSTWKNTNPAVQYGKLE